MDRDDISQNQRKSDSKPMLEFPSKKSLFMGLLIGIAVGHLASNETSWSHKFPFNVENLIKHSDGFNSGVFLNDLVGHDKNVQEIKPLISLLSLPSSLPVGFKLPGLVFYGPEGTGKRLAAKAIANEAHAKFYEICMEDLINDERSKDIDNIINTNSAKVVFVTKSDMFLPEQYKEMAMGIVKILPFNDNDCFSSQGLTGNVRMLRKLTNKIMDGTSLLILSSSDKILKPALIADNFVQLEFTNPDTKSRALLFQRKLPQVQGINDTDRTALVDKLAVGTHGLNGKEISEICNRAMIKALGRNEMVVKASDVEKEVKEIKESKPILKEWEKQTVAYHEAGHAVVSWKLEHADEMLAVSIVPDNKGALGFTRYSNKNNVLYTKEQVFAKICVLLAGRYSEQYFMNRETTGARDDLSRVTGLAYYSVASYGFHNHLTSFEDFRASKRMYGEEVSKEIDNDVKEIIMKANGIAKDLVNKHWDAVDKVAKALLQKDTLTYLDMQEILGPSSCSPRDSVATEKPAITSPPFGEGVAVFNI